MALRHPVCGQPSVDPLTDTEGFGRLPELPLENAVEVLLGGKPAGVGDLRGTAISESFRPSLIKSGATGADYSSFKCRWLFAATVEEQLAEMKKAGCKADLHPYS